MSEMYASFVSRVRAARGRMLRAHVYAGLGGFLVIGLALLIVAVATESMFHLSITGRTVAVCVVAAASIAAFAWYVVPSLMRLLGLRPRPSVDETAHMIGARYPAVYDALANALQLQRVHGEQSQPGYSTELVQAAFDAVARTAAPLDFGVIADSKPVRRSAAYAGGALVVLFGLLAAGSTRDAAFRLAHFSTSFAPPPPFEFLVIPGNVRCIRGDSVLVTIKTVGREPQHEIVLYTRENDQQSPRQTVLRSTDGTFNYRLDNVKRTVEYSAERLGIESEKYVVSVSDRPDVKSLAVHLAYPAYIHAAAVQLDENVGDIIAICGAQAHLAITLNKAIASGFIVFTPDTSLRDSLATHESHTALRTPLTVSGDHASGTLTVRSPGSYVFELKDSDGIGNIEPIVYHVTALNDEFPTVRVIQPQAVTDITETARIGVVARIHDDYGFSRLTLHYRLSASKWAQPWPAFRELQIPLGADGKTDMEIPYIWDLRPFALVPEDAMEFYVEVFDNDIVNGPKSARSEVLSLRLPSLEVALDESDHAQHDASENLQEAERAAEELTKQMEQATRELRQQAQEKNLSWQEQKKMKDILQRHEQLQNKIADAQKQLEESLNKLESKQALSPETLQKYLELQKLFQELKSPELAKAMQRLQEAMEKITPDQMRAAMKNLAVNEEQFRKSIERTMQMLKRIQTEQKTDELMKRADQLEREQNALQEKMAQTKTGEERSELSEQQKDLAERTKEMENAFKELQKSMKDMGKEMPNEEMSKTSDELQQDSPDQEMQDASQQMSSDPQSAKSHQQKAQKGMQNFKKNMADVKKRMQENQARQAMTEMRRSLQDLLDLAKKEDALKRQTEQTESNSASLPEQAKEQSNLQSDLANVVNRMMKLAEKSFSVTPEMGRELGRALKEMQNATGNLEQRQPQQAGQNQGNAVGAMNGAAMMMQQAMESMAKGQGQPGSGGMQSFLQQLNQMAGEQEQINGMTQKLGNQGQLSIQQQAEMQRLSAQQDAVRQSLEQARKQQEQLTGGKKNTLGDLGKVAEEMQEVINDMRANNVRPETIQRQERILSRLLDAQRSQHERDFDKKREGKTGADVTRDSPAPLPTPTRTQSVEELLRLQEAGYTKDYERKIRKYFEALKGTQQR